MAQSKVEKSYEFLQIIPGGGFKAVYATKSGGVESVELPAFALAKVTESVKGEADSTYRTVIGVSTSCGGAEMDEFEPLHHSDLLGYCGPNEDATELFADEARRHIARKLAEEQVVAAGSGSR